MKTFVKFLFVTMIFCTGVSIAEYDYQQPNHLQPFEMNKASSNIECTLGQGSCSGD